MDEKDLRITLLLKSNRITVRKNCLATLGDPESVLLLISPEEQALLLSANPNADPRGVKVHRDKKGFTRIVSKPLCDAIVAMARIPDRDATVTLFGQRVERGILFSLGTSSRAEGRIAT